MNLKIGKGAPPLYHQIKEILEKKINNGEYPAGSIFPSECELQNLFSVSRVTVRQAVQLLTADGLLEPHRGIGTIVKERKFFNEQIEYIKSFSNEMRERNITPGLSYADFRMERAGIEVAQNMQLDENDLVCHITRIRTGDGIPMLFEECYFPEHMSDILQDNYQTSSLYATLLENGIRIERTKDSYSAGLANFATAHALNIKPNSAVMIRTRISYDKEGNIIEYTKMNYNASLYSYTIELYNH